MQVHTYPTKVESGKAAAVAGAAKIRDAIERHGAATIIVATGASQFEMLDALVSEPDISWDKVSAFHLDEYVGLPLAHPASFRLYLWRRFVSRLPVPIGAFHYLDAEHNPQAECLRVGNLIRGATVDVAFVGIGENGHLAFNDPPADFETIEPYHVVQLDEACRKQQLGEGWFPSLADVPAQAISMTIHQILSARAIVCTVPDQRKAKAVRDAVKGPITPEVPAAILQKHPDCALYLDKAAGELL